MTLWSTIIQPTHEMLSQRKHRANTHHLHGQCGQQSRHTVLIRCVLTTQLYNLTIGLAAHGQQVRTTPTHDYMVSFNTITQHHK